MGRVVQRVVAALVGVEGRAEDPEVGGAGVEVHLEGLAADCDGDEVFGALVGGVAGYVADARAGCCFVARWRSRGRDGGDGGFLARGDAEGGFEAVAGGMGGLVLFAVGFDIDDDAIVEDLVV